MREKEDKIKEITSIIPRLEKKREDLQEEVRQTEEKISEIDDRIEFFSRARESI